MGFDKSESTFQDLFASSNPTLLKHFELLADGLSRYFRDLPSMQVNPRPSLSDVHESLGFALGNDTYPLEHLITKFTKDLGRHLLHVDHPMYFGVFNPNPIFSGVVADVLVSQMNAQLASSASALYAIEIEKKLLSYFGQKVGYAQGHLDGTFCSGGTEANITAVLCALWRRAPEFFKNGSQKITGRLAVYTSIETHHSLKKALRILGLGQEALRVVETDLELRFSVSGLRDLMKKDHLEGIQPILIVGTLGSTSAGVIDSISELAKIATEYSVDLHIDAAWGGGALLLPEMASQLAGLNLANSITIDAHKWFAVPMTAGIFISRHYGILRSVFNVGKSPYMPPSSFQDSLTEPFAESMQWSRRFMGLKLLFPLLALGEVGYQKLFRHSMHLAQFFRQRLEANGNWCILNQTPLPVVCVRPQGMQTKAQIEDFAERINSSGRAWITSTTIGNFGNNRQSVLRVGFPNFATEQEHVEHLFELLEEQRLRAQVPRF